MSRYQQRVTSWFKQATYAMQNQEAINQVEAKSKSDQVWIPTYVEITAGNKNN